MHCWSFSISGAFLLNLIATQGIVTPKKEKKKKTLFPSIPHTLPREMMLVKNHWLRPVGIYLGTELCVYSFLFPDWFGGKRGTKQY